MVRPGGLSKGWADEQCPTKQNAGAYLLNTRFLVASIPGSTRAPRSCRGKKKHHKRLRSSESPGPSQKPTGSTDAVMARGPAAVQLNPGRGLLHPCGARRAAGSSSTMQGAQICCGAPMGTGLRCSTSQPRQRRERGQDQFLPLIRSDETTKVAFATVIAKKNPKDPQKLGKKGRF